MRCVWADVLGGQCSARTFRVFYVNRIPGAWPACHHHGRRVLKDLMAQFPGHGVFSRRLDR